jgi:hypothetical protein
VSGTGGGGVVLQRHQSHALTGGGRERALHLEGAAELGDAEHEDDEQRHDQGELHRGRTAFGAQLVAHRRSPPSGRRAGHVPDTCNGAAAPARRPLRR